MNYRSYSSYIGWMNAYTVIQKDRYRGRSSRRRDFAWVTSPSIHSPRDQRILPRNRRVSIQFAARDSRRWLRWATARSPISYPRIESQRKRETRLDTRAAIPIINTRIVPLRLRLSVGFNYPVPREEDATPERRRGGYLWVTGIVCLYGESRGVR